MIEAFLKWKKKHFPSDQDHRDAGFNHAHALFVQLGERAAIDKLWEEPRDSSLPFDKGIIEYTHSRMDAADSALATRHRMEWDNRTNMRKKAKDHVNDFFD